MVKLFRDSVALSDLWVSSHEKLSDFYLSSWQRGESAVPMLVIRLFLFMVSVGLLAWSVYMGPNPFFLIYLTNWGMILVTVTSLSGLIVSCMAINKKFYETSQLPWYVGMYWIVYNVTGTIAVFITVFYWAILYTPPDWDEPSAVKAFWHDMAVHAGNSVIVLADYIASRTPLYFLHFYQPLGLGLWYAVFSGIYFVAGGTDPEGNTFIYNVLDWNNSRRAGALVAISTASVIFLYIVLWAVTLARDKVSETVARTTSQNLPPTPPDDYTNMRVV